MVLPNWNRAMIAVAVSFHGVAILSTVFRLWYRRYTARIWWDDAWATLALLADVAFLVVAVLEQPVPYESLPQFFTLGNWIIAFAYPALMWATRMSILATMVRVSHPEGMLRHSTIGIGVLFGVMAIAMLGQRLQICVEIGCLVTRAILITQTTMDCIADVLLSALPIWVLRNMKLRRRRKILISSVFSASIIICVVSVVEAVVLFQTRTSGSIIIEHVKVACSMIVCNLFVMVTFVYHIVHKQKTGLEDSEPETNKFEFTTVDLGLGVFSQESSHTNSFSVTKSSTWSFTGSRSQPSASVTAAVSRIDNPGAANGEDERYGRSTS